ncbi:hypothetical protein RsoM2USA_103 [Ralstonia phage RsoM2USA]|nr:hypothetical protein RsoM2USA_103 [Ralstonia phage RsoM2USA]
MFGGSLIGEPVFVMHLVLRSPPTNDRIIFKGFSELGEMLLKRIEIVENLKFVVADRQRIPHSSTEHNGDLMNQNRVGIVVWTKVESLIMITTINMHVRRVGFNVTLNNRNDILFFSIEDYATILTKCHPRIVVVLKFADDSHSLILALVITVSLTSLNSP